MKQIKAHGFTLTELIVTLAIGALFLTFAVPSYYAMIQNNKAVTVVNKLSSSLNFAKMEAIKRGVRVSVCPAANAALTACGTSGQWAQGWIVYVDANSNNAIDSTNDLVKVSEALPQGTTITANTALISYDGSGFVTSGAVTMSIAATGCTGDNGRTVTLSASGRLSIAKATCS